MTHPDHALLVRVALDDFDRVPLEVSARRAYRVARLLGHTYEAHRLVLEMSPAGRAGNDKMASVASIHDVWDGQEIRDLNSGVLEIYIEGRTIGDADDLNEGSMLNGSIAEIRLDLESTRSTYDLAVANDTWDIIPDLLATIRSRQEVLERINVYVFDYLVRTEAQLGVSDAVTALLDRHRLSVDTLLDEVAPDLRDKLAAALRAAGAGDAESRVHVLTTCRRVIEKVADHLYPPSDQPFVDEDGHQHAVGQGNYRNRLLAALGSQVTTAKRAFVATVNDFDKRLEALDKLAQKGVHDEVTLAEMEFGLAQTYLLAGEMLSSELDGDRELPVTD